MDQYQKVYTEIKLLLEKLPDDDESETKETLNIIYSLLQDNRYKFADQDERRYLRANINVFG